MGEIISTRRASERDQVIVETLLNQDEYLQLQGHMDNIHLFSGNLSDTHANISQRGKSYTTKYFLIPRKLRNGFKFTKNVLCQRIDSKNNILFVYCINRME